MHVSVCLTWPNIVSLSYKKLVTGSGYMGYGNQLALLCFHALIARPYCTYK